MADFDLKKWLDEHVVPLTNKEPRLRIYSFIWNGNPPKEVLVWLLAGCEPIAQPPEPAGVPDEVDAQVKLIAEDMRAALAPTEFDESAWPRAVKRLLEEDDFRFDFLREQQMVKLENGLVPVFGGDGAPLFGKEGTASARLFRKMDDGIGLILQVGCHYPGTEATAELDAMNPGKHAAAAVKGFFALFDDNPMIVCQKFGAAFGAA
jgi:hypothetical protein